MRTVVVLLAVAVGLAGAGCGGGGDSSSSKPLTKAEYQAQLQELSDQAGADLKASLGTSKKLKKGDLPKIQNELDSMAAKVEAMNPPAEVKDLHVRLVKALRDLGVALPAMIAALDKAKDPSEALVALFGNPAIQELTKLQQEFKDKGYDVSGLLNSS